MRNARHSLIALAVGALLVSAAPGLAMPWSRDMYEEPSVSPSESAGVPPPEHAVPVTGEEPEVRSRIAAGRTLTNPVAATEASILNGHKLFATYCSPCHGAEGHGDGPVARKLAVPPDFRSEQVRKRADGFLYATIRIGGVIMPSYGHVLSPQERWDLVNFIRSLQEGP